MVAGSAVSAARQRSSKLHCRSWTKARWCPPRSRLPTGRVSGSALSSGISPTWIRSFLLRTTCCSHPMRRCLRLTIEQALWRRVWRGRWIFTVTRSTSCARLFCARRRSCGALPSSEKITHGIRNDCAKSSSCGCLKCRQCLKTLEKRYTRWLLSTCGIDCASTRGCRPKPAPTSFHYW